MPPPTHSATATVTYVDLTVPADQVPASWYIGLRNSPDGTPVGTEQVFPMPFPTATFTGVSPGTYEFWAGQRNASGGEVGTVKKSSPFVLNPDVLIKAVDTITVTIS